MRFEWVNKWLSIETKLSKVAPDCLFEIKNWCYHIVASIPKDR
jgi:hypothetical protein